MTKKERIKLDKYYTKKYGVDFVWYENQLKLQNDRCALCFKHKSNFSKRMHLDHNHTTGKVRGILCYYCNRRRVSRLTYDWAFRICEYLYKYEGGPL